MTRPESAEERIEFVRRAIDAFNRRDIEAMRSVAGDDFEYDWSRSRGPNRGVYKGPDGFFEFLSDQWEMFDPFELEADEFIPRGNHVYTFDGRRLVRITMFQELDEALAATGGD